GAMTPRHEADPRADWRGDGWTKVCACGDEERLLAAQPRNAREDRAHCSEDVRMETQEARREVGAQVLRFCRKPVRLSTQLDPSQRTPLEPLEQGHGPGFRICYSRRGSPSYRR